jgi:hypothetical protein
MLESFSFLPSRRRTNILFLAGHGLRTQLSTLRWASSRLRKSSATLTKEQRHLAEEIYDHTRILTTAMNAMLLLNRLEGREYAPRPETIDLLPVLQAAGGAQEHPSAEWTFSCEPGVAVRADRSVLDHLFACLGVLCVQATTEPRKIFVSVQAGDRSVQLHMHARWELPLLVPGAADPGDASILGGTPGLMLSMAREMARFLQGSVELEEIPSEDGDLVTDGTVERVSAHPPAEYRISVTLPKR